MPGTEEALQETECPVPSLRPEGLLYCLLHPAEAWGPGIACRQGSVRSMLTCQIKLGHLISLYLKGQSPRSLSSTQDQQ